MKNALLVCLLFVSSSAASELAHTREPIAFSDPYHDGYNWTVWNQHTDDELNLMLDRLKESGAKNIQVPFWGCQSTKTSSDVGGCELIPREYMLRQVDLAMAKGFKAKILPLLGSKDWNWRGNFTPTDVDAWFENYTRWIVDLAHEAKLRGQSEFVVASEYNALYVHEDRWRKVVEEVRKVFPGPLILTVNWDNLNHKFWDSVDAIGVSAYFPLAKGNDPEQAELDRSWQAHKKTLMKLSNQFKRPIHMTEVGYSNTDNAAKSPWAASDNGVINDALPARCFEAFKKAWQGEQKLIRMNVWSYGASYEFPGAITGDPIGKPAEGVLKSFFDSRLRIRRD